MYHITIQTISVFHLTLPQTGMSPFTRSNIFITTELIFRRRRRARADRDCVWADCVTGHELAPYSTTINKYAFGMRASAVVSGVINRMLSCKHNNPLFRMRQTANGSGSTSEILPTTTTVHGGGTSSRGFGARVRIKSTRNPIVHARALKLDPLEHQTVRISEQRCAYNVMKIR